MDNSKKHLVLVQASRAFVPLAIILFHVSLVIKNYYGYNFLWLAYLGKTGGVDYFFALSGFMMYYVYHKKFEDKKRFKNFAVSRLIRIYPLYWILTLLLIPVYFIFPSFGQGYETDLIVILKSLLLIPQTHEPILFVGWSLSHTLLFYILFSFFFINRRITITAISIWTLGIILHYLNILNSSTIYNFIFHKENINFISGLICAAIVVKYRINNGYLYFFLGMFGFPLTWVLKNVGLLFIPEELLYGCSSFMLILGIAGLDLRKNIHLPKPVVFLGNASFSIFLSNFTTIVVLAKVSSAINLSKYFPLWLISVAWVILSVITGCIIYLFIESKLTKYLTSRLLAKKQIKKEPDTELLKEAEYKYLEINQHEVK